MGAILESFSWYFGTQTALKKCYALDDIPERFWELPPAPAALKNWIFIGVLFKIKGRPFPLRVPPGAIFEAQMVQNGFRNRPKKHKKCTLKMHPKFDTQSGAQWFQNGLKMEAQWESILEWIGVSFWSFGVHLGSCLHHFGARICDKFSKCVFNEFWVHVEVHFGTISHLHGTVVGRPKASG